MRDDNLAYNGEALTIELKRMKMRDENEIGSLVFISWIQFLGEGNTVGSRPLKFLD